MCEGRSNIFKALGYLFFSPLWSVVIHLYRLVQLNFVSSNILIHIKRLHYLEPWK